MCRFALHLGRPLRLDTLLTEPPNSIIHQSYHSHEGADTVNGDGFGVAWYAPDVSDSLVVVDHRHRVELRRVA